jgi:hypothetical protein
MAQATGFDPKVSSVSSVLYCTPTDDDRAFIIAYPAGQTLTELSPKGSICQPGTLAVSPTTW